MCNCQFSPAQRIQSVQKYKTSGTCVVLTYLAAECKTKTA